MLSVTTKKAKKMVVKDNGNVLPENIRKKYFSRSLLLNRLEEPH
jgi:hypothetical protein